MTQNLKILLLIMTRTAGAAATECEKEDLRKCTLFHWGNDDHSWGIFKGWCGRVYVYILSNIDGLSGT